MEKIKELWATCLAWIQKHARIIVGLAIFVCGLLLIARSIIFIVNMAIFIAGLMLVYYSFRLLNLTEVTNTIDGHVQKIKDRFFR